MSDKLFTLGTFTVNIPKVDNANVNSNNNNVIESNGDFPIPQGKTGWNSFSVDVPSTTDNADVNSNNNNVIKSNGDFPIPQGKTGWNAFSVDVPVPNIGPGGTRSFTSNVSNYTIQPSWPYDAMTDLKININVPSINNYNLGTITKNGTYTVPVGYSGFATIYVNINPEDPNPAPGEDNPSPTPGEENPTPTPTAPSGQDTYIDIPESSGYYYAGVYKRYNGEYINAYPASYNKGSISGSFGPYNDVITLVRSSGNKSIWKFFSIKFQTWKNRSIYFDGDLYDVWNDPQSNNITFYVMKSNGNGDLNVAYSTAASHNEPDDELTSINLSDLSVTTLEITEPSS